jgi:hypothetical protein
LRNIQETLREQLEYFREHLPSLSEDWTSHREQFAITQGTVVSLLDEDLPLAVTQWSLDITQGTLAITQGILVITQGTLAITQGTVASLLDEDLPPVFQGTFAVTQ